MSAKPAIGAVQTLRGSACALDAGLTDGELLEWYIDGREEAAFADLVGRHGPMVWNVCCRILGNHHDAEDAFQATFLVLARKASGVKPREMVARWLYRVAYHAALRTRKMAERDRQRQRQMAELPERTPDEVDHWHDLQPVLDQELSRLPAIYRDAIILCDLQGKTHKEAARQIGCPEGTVSARLSRAKAMLAKRLTRRHGLTVSGVSLAMALAQNVASASMPASVAPATIKAATLFAAHQGTSTALSTVISVKAAAIAEGVLKGMLLSKLKIGAACLLAAFFVLGGLVVADKGRLGQARAEVAKSVPVAVLQGENAKFEQDPTSSSKPAASVVLVAQDVPASDKPPADKPATPNLEKDIEDALKELEKVEKRLLRDQNPAEVDEDAGLTFTAIVHKGSGKVTILQNDKEEVAPAGEKGAARLENGVLYLNGSGDFTIHVKQLKRVASEGRGSIDAKGLKLKNLHVLIAAGSVDLQGSMDELLVVASGGAFKGQDLKARKAIAVAAGDAKIVVNANAELHAQASGVGKVEYLGSPRLERKTSGSGTVVERPAEKATPSK